MNIRPKTRQKALQLHRYMLAYQERNEGVPPTMRGAIKTLDFLNSTSHVRYLLQILVEMGLVVQAEHSYRAPRAYVAMASSIFDAETGDEESFRDAEPLVREALLDFYDGQHRRKYWLNRLRFGPGELVFLAREVVGKARDVRGLLEASDEREG